MRDSPEGELRLGPLAVLKKPSPTIDITSPMARPTVKSTEPFKRKRGRSAKRFAKKCAK